MRDKLLNQLFLSSLIQIDASSGNRDGTGILTTVKGESKVWKSHLPGDGISNLGLVISQQITNSNPVIAHVRAASKGIEVTRENAHPFKASRFSLAHNGRLYNRNEEVVWSNDTDSGVTSDSKLFLEEMEKMNDENPGISIVDVLNSCMNNHMGKFALMIHDSHTDKHYVVRGETADLHRLDILIRDGEDVTPIGFIVNTKKLCLKEAALLSLPIAQIASKGWLEAGDVVELDKNSIYEVDGIDLVKVGEVKENAVVYAKFTTTQTSQNFMARTSVEEINSKEANIKLIMRIQEFARDHFLNIEDIDALFYIFNGVPMYKIGVEDLRIFVDQVIPKISASSVIRNQIASIIRHDGKVHSIVYSRVPDLEYPWMCNEPEKITSMLNFLRSEKKAMG